jgi:hypothetical protein
MLLRTFSYPVRVTLQLGIAEGTSHISPVV